MKKHMKKRAMSLFMAVVMVISLIPAMTIGAFAVTPTGVTLLQDAPNGGIRLTAGETYYIDQDTTINYNNGNNSGRSQNGLIVGTGDAVTLCIPAGVTLTVYGKDGSGVTGGGAAVLLPDGATLIVVGGGTLDVHGGNAANGSYGEAGEWSAAQDDDPEGNESNEKNGDDYYHAGKGGNGGNGGGGGGAGIGTDGGTGGSGDGVGGDYWGWTKAMVGSDGLQHGTKNGNNASDGASGSSADEMGNLYVSSEITIAGQGGSAGSNTASGGACGSSHYEYDDEHERGVAGSAGGGAGGAGWGGALVGTGGGGGGQGGGGGNSGYLCRYFYIGGGGGAGGWGANSSHGNDGSHGPYEKFGEEPLADDEKKLTLSLRKLRAAEAIGITKVPTAGNIPLNMLPAATVAAAAPAAAKRPLIHGVTPNGRPLMLPLTLIRTSSPPGLLPLL